MEDSNGRTARSGFLVPSLAAKFWDHLLGRQDEPVQTGVSQLNAVDIRDMGNPKGPVKGGAGRSVEDTGDAASLVVLPMNGKESVVSSVCQVIHCVVSRSWCRCVAPWEEDELTVAVESLVEDYSVLSSTHKVADIAILNLREGFRAIICLGAAIARGSSLGPVEVPVPVGISPLADITVVLGRGLSPHAIV